MTVVPDPVRLLGVPVHPLSAEQLVATLVEWGRGERVRVVLNVNAYAMNLAHRDATFREALRTADLVFCDGYGVKWGARLVGEDIPYRLTPPDWIDRFAAAAATAGQSVFALGDEDGVAAAFQRALVARHPQYLDAGSHHGFFHKSGTANDAVLAQIAAARPTHLLVGFGMPLQERWISENAHRLKVTTVLSVGALFRWRSGVEKRAPRWMTDHGLEWLSRLAKHPVRHFKRYIIGNPLFMYRVLKERRHS